MSHQIRVKIARIATAGRRCEAERARALQLAPPTRWDTWTRRGRRGTPSGATATAAPCRTPGRDQA
jgi:hypothetical protein